jgi:hypothetical protein
MTQPRTLPRPGGFSPERLEYQLKRRGLNRSSLMKEPARLSPSTVTDIFKRPGYCPTGDVLIRIRDHLHAYPVDPVIDSLMDPPTPEDSAA